MEDHYTTLGVERGASQDDIKRAYRKMAHQHHPDKDGGDEEKFKQVNAAYQVLKDDQKRAQYDQYGQTFEDGGAGASGFNPFGGGSQRVNINVEDLGGIPGVGDIFEQFFGGRGGQTKATSRGRDVSIDVSISFEDSAKGIKKQVQHRLYQKCTKCSGNGAEPGTPIKECVSCQGKGVVSSTQQTILGSFAHNTTCSTCQGEGKTAEKKCNQCSGQGRELKDRELEIEVPAGIADGQTIRISGKGETPAHGGSPGDLYATVHVGSHSALKRENNDVRSTITIPFTKAALGTSIQAETLAGDQKIVVPAGTQPGSQQVLRGKGFPNISGGAPGDQIITINVSIPKKLSRKQKQLLEELNRTKEKKGIFS